MKALLRFAIASAVAGLAACASTQDRTTATAQVTQPRTGMHFEGDAEYVAAVEYVARRRGVQVQWVNPPVRRVSPPNQ